MTEAVKLWYLKNYDLFQGISQREIKKLATNSQMQECDEVCTIYRPYEATGHIYVVKKGEVQLYYQKGEKTYVFDTLGPGSVFGNISLNTSQPYGHFARGSAGVCVCAFSVEEFLNIIRAHPEVMLRYMKDMSHKVLEYQTQMQNNQAGADEIVLHELARLQQKRQQTFLGKLIDRPLRVTHEELGELTGLNRVTVTRSMKRLREMGDIEYDPKTGVIVVVE